MAKAAGIAFLTKDGWIREGGRIMRDMYLERSNRPRNPAVSPGRQQFRGIPLAANRARTVGGLGSVTEKAANVFSDFALVDIFANFCLGREDAKGAINIAERQLQRIYRSI